MTIRARPKSEGGTPWGYRLESATSPPCSAEGPAPTRDLWNPAYLRWLYRYASPEGKLLLIFTARRSYDQIRWPGKWDAPSLTKRENEQMQSDARTGEAVQAALAARGCAHASVSRGLSTDPKVIEAVADVVAAGHSRKAVARCLDVSVKTVRRWLEVP